MEILSNPTKEEWNRIIDKFEHRNIFHTYDYHKFMCDNFGYKMYILQNDYSAIPFLVMDRGGLLKPFLKYALILSSPLSNVPFQPYPFPALIRLIIWLKMNKITALEFGLYTEIENKNVLETFGIEPQERATFITDLTKSEEELLKSFDKRTRYSVKKSQDNNLIFREISTPKEYHKLNEETTNRANSKGGRLGHRSIGYFDNVVKHLVNNNLAKIFIASNGIDLLAGAIILTYNKKLFYWNGVSTSNHRELNAGNFLHWNILKWGKENGYEEYNWGGVTYNPPKDSPDYDLYRFKQGWGGEYKLFWFGKKILNPFRYKIGEILKEGYTKIHRKV
jgi:lipid II:glycine glycyltransferase (peptidoglycan interpeptide bridge formation enzyme)